MRVCVIPVITIVNMSCRALTFKGERYKKPVKDPLILIVVSLHIVYKTPVCALAVRLDVFGVDNTVCTVHLCIHMLLTINTKNFIVFIKL